METPKVKVTQKLCDTMMDCFAALAYTVTGDLKASEKYAKNRFLAIMYEWEDVNGFEFEIVE